MSQLRELAEKTP